jgi:aspartyl-tRNA(Asn)/glutamyl-tRNA(Gln) amidotransferase subunit B
MIRRVWRPSSRWQLGQRVQNSDGGFVYKAGGASIHRNSSNATDTLPYRQHLKLEAKRRKQDSIESSSSGVEIDDQVDGAAWELTVGIEIHAQLDTERKLFSTAATSNTNDPNSSVGLCDLAYPGAQPVFQTATLLPALRAAIAFNCNIKRKSSFDRKHYFYPDQPAGYQITQFYGS